MIPKYNGYSLPEMMGFYPTEANTETADLLGLYVPPQREDKSKYIARNGLLVPRDYYAFTTFNLSFGTTPTYLTLSPNWFRLVDALVETPPPPPIVKSETTDYITGYRHWRYVPVGKDRALIGASVHQTVWPAGEPLESFRMPEAKNTDGCYAYETPEKFESMTDFSSVEIYGDVALWGKVFVHSDGIIRAQFAYPLKLRVNPGEFSDAQAVAQRLARAYGCEVVILDRDCDDDD